MRIFTAVRHSIDPSLYYGGLWSGNFHPALDQLGHEIVQSHVDLYPASRFMDVANGFTPQEQEVRAQITQLIIEEVRRAHREQPLDLFLSYFYNAHFDPAGFDEIHRLGIPTINFYCNSIYQLALVSEIASKVNFAWHSEKEARQLYQKVGANPVWVQMGADPRVYHPLTQINRQAKACFVGQRYADRDRLLANLISHRVPVDIYGVGWNSNTSGNGDGKATEKQNRLHLGRRTAKPGGLLSYAQASWRNIEEYGFLPGTRRTFRQLRYRSQSRHLNPLLNSATKGLAQNISQTFAQYEVILNFSNVWADGRPGSPLIPHLRLRDFEGPMCRTCYLTGYSEEITEFYVLGKEIDAYRSQEELVEKTKYYLSHPVVAERLREAGYRRALRDHTWKRRFQQLFREIGLKNE